MVVLRLRSDLRGSGGGAASALALVVAGARAAFRVAALLLLPFCWWCCGCGGGGGGGVGTRRRRERTVSSVGTTGCEDEDEDDEDGAGAGSRPPRLRFVRKRLGRFVSRLDLSPASLPPLEGHVWTSSAFSTCLRGEGLLLLSLLLLLALNRRWVQWVDDAAAAAATGGDGDGDGDGGGGRERIVARGTKSEARGGYGWPDLGSV